MQKRSQDFLQQRKLAVFLPVIVVPFLSIIFWLIGGGKGVAMSEKDGKMVIKGLNNKIPTVGEKAEIYSSKLKAYDNSSSDSLKKKKNNSHSMLEIGRLDDFFKKSTDSLHASNSSLANTGLNVDVNRTMEQRVNAPENVSMQRTHQNLERLNKAINTPSNSNSGSGSRVNIDPSLQKILDDQSKRQADMMEIYKKSMEKMNTPPDVVNSNIPEQKTEERENKISVKLDNKPKSVVHVYDSENTGKMYADKTLVKVEDDYQFNNPLKKGSISDDANVIAAVIHDEQTLVSGSTVKVRLLNNIRVGSSTIPKNTFVFGICSFNNDRLNIDITSIRFAETIFPVSMTIFDVDGIKGIFIPGSSSRTATKTGLSQGISSGNFYQGYSNTVQTQLTQTAIETAKNIVSKKATLVRVTLKSNYKIYLKPEEK